MSNVCLSSKMSSIVNHLEYAKALFEGTGSKETVKGILDNLVAKLYDLDNWLEKLSRVEADELSNWRDDKLQEVWDLVDRVNKSKEEALKNVAIRNILIL